MTPETIIIELNEEVYVVLNAESRPIAIAFGWHNAEAICKATGATHAIGKLSDMTVRMDATGNCITLPDVEKAIKRDGAQRDPPPSKLWCFNGDVWQRRNVRKKLLYIVSRDCNDEEKWFAYEAGRLMFDYPEEATNDAPRFDSPLLAMQAVEAFIAKSGPDPTIAVIAEP